MSKQRPSNGPLERADGAESVGYWRGRVFKNTYTRGGRCVQLKRWSIKIQHRGTRRTFSLAARSRGAAAVEARAIHEAIVTQGWHAAPATLSRTGSRPESLAKTEARYWKPRLLRRPHSEVSGPGVGFSARIEHTGVSHYFPLGTAHEDAAAARARDIYAAIATHGWTAASQRFPREVTVALQWADNPLAWTYATFHTEVGSLPPRQCDSQPKAGVFPVVVVEPDVSILTALSRRLNRQDGFASAATFTNAKDAFKGILRPAPRLVLVDRNLPDSTPGEFSDKLHRMAPELPVLFFAIYEDSDQLFKATPGGASGYLLKRTVPDRLLEPIVAAVEEGRLSHDRIAQHVRRYFQNVIVPLSADRAARDLTRLTHREHEILNLLSKGYVDKEIAEALGISVWTVHGHLKRVFEKLGVHTRTEAAIKYLHK